MKMEMKDILFFDSMVTPKIITFVYWLLLIALVIAGIVFGIAMIANVGFLGVFIALLAIPGILAGAVVIRMYCELMIVLFKIHENLSKIANK